MSHYFFCNLILLLTRIGWILKQGHSRIINNGKSQLFDASWDSVYSRDRVKVKKLSNELQISCRQLELVATSAPSTLEIFPKILYVAHPSFKYHKIIMALSCAQVDRIRYWREHLWHSTGLAGDWRVFFFFYTVHTSFRLDFQPFPFYL